MIIWKSLLFEESRIQLVISITRVLQQDLTIGVNDQHNLSLIKNRRMLRRNNFIASHSVINNVLPGIIASNHRKLNLVSQSSFQSSK